MAERVSWLVLVYRVPSEPTRLRAAVWRRLKALGAVYLANSVAALPASAEFERALRSLRNEIGEWAAQRSCSRRTRWPAKPRRPPRSSHQSRSTMRRRVDHGQRR